MKGKSFEKNWGNKLTRLAIFGQLYAGQWFEFRDEVGYSFAQPDFFIVQDCQIVLYECKLTQNDGAWDQMYQLYAPILEHYFGLPVACIQVCKYLRHYDEGITRDLETIEDGTTIHWFRGK